MKILLAGCLVLFVSCRSSPGKREAAKESVRDTPIVAMDTPPAGGAIGAPPVDAKRKPPLTHLHDTLAVSGNFILFLRPDNARYDSETAGDEENGESEGDADFGAGIAGTEDSVAGNPKYKDIRVLVSTKRYILIKDCKDGPVMIDRDTVDYGYILSGIGKPVAWVYNEVHSGHYLGEINDYFSIRQ